MSFIVQIEIGFEVYGSVLEVGVFDYVGAFGVRTDYLHYEGLLCVPLDVPSEAAAFGATGEVFVQIHYVTHFPKSSQFLFY